MQTNNAKIEPREINFTNMNDISTDSLKGCDGGFELPEIKSNFLNCFL